MKQGLNATELKAYRDRIMYACTNLGSLGRMVEHYLMLANKAMLNSDQETAWSNLCKAQEKVFDYCDIHEKLRSVLMDMDKDLEELDPESHDKLVAELSRVMTEANK